MNDAMTMSHTGLKMIMQAEGLRLEAYRCPANVLTIGYGHTGTDVTEGMTINEAQAVEFLRDDVRFAEIGVRTYATVPLTQSQFDALVDFAYNCGVGAMRGSTMLKKLNSRDYLGASEEMLRWNRAGGKVMAGLTKRREAEKDMFLDGTEQA